MQRVNRPMLLQRAPRPALRPLVKLLWAADRTTSSAMATSDREHVLPTGTMYLLRTLRGGTLFQIVHATNLCGFVRMDRRAQRRTARLERLKRAEHKYDLNILHFMLYFGIK